MSRVSRSIQRFPASSNCESLGCRLARSFPAGVTITSAGSENCTALARWAPGHGRVRNEKNDLPSTVSGSGIPPGLPSTLKPIVVCRVTAPGGTLNVTLKLSRSPPASGVIVVWASKPPQVSGGISTFSRGHWTGIPTSLVDMAAFEQPALAANPQTRRRRESNPIDTSDSYLLPFPVDIAPLWHARNRLSPINQGVPRPPLASRGTDPSLARRAPDRCSRRRRANTCSRRHRSRAQREPRR
jgi:hypothetical protein